MSLVELQKGLTDLLPSNGEGCGVDYPTYSFTQIEGEVVVLFPLPAGVTSKQLDITIATHHLSVGYKNGKPPASAVESGAAPADGIMLRGSLYKPIKAEASMWTIETRKKAGGGGGDEMKFLVVTLTKTNMQYEEWWPHVVTAERQMDIKTLVPPAKHIRDLDQGAQATVAKMMFDQEQKRKGLPTSDELNVKNMMASAMGGGNGNMMMTPPGFAPPSV